MIVRSVVLGLLVAALISAGCYFYDHIIGQGKLVPHLMPTVIYGGLIVSLLFVNPLLKRLRPAWVFSKRGLAAIAVLGLVACSIPSWGLVQGLVPTVIMPHHHVRREPVLGRARIIEQTPAEMLVDVSADRETVLLGYVEGLGEGERHIAFGDVPWRAWGRTLWFWVPLVVCMVVGTLGLAVVYHHQWARREHLSYPVSTFAHALLPDSGQARNAVFRKRLFWLGTMIVLVIRVNNFGNQLWPDVFFIEVPLHVDLGGGGLLRPSITFLVIGLAYFIPTRVSISIGLSPILYAIVCGMLIERGITLRDGHHLIGHTEAYVFAGGYFGILLMLLYTGRRFYWTVLRQSFCVPAADKAQPVVVWGMRLFLAGLVLFVLQLWRVGLAMHLAILYTGVAVMIYTVVSRIVAETGAFHIGTTLLPGTILVGFLGAASVGTEAVMIMGLVSGVLLLSPGWATMPFAVQALKLADMSQVNVPRVARWGLPTVLLCLAIALPLTIYWQYDQGARPDWPVHASVYPVRQAVAVEKLRQQGTLATAESSWAPGNVGPDHDRIKAFVITAGLALIVSMCYFRFAWWPLHPVIFVFLGSLQAVLMWFSCLVGCAIKLTVTKSGGKGMYDRLKPLMIGLIAGEVLSQLVPMLVGTVYYIAVGQRLILKP